MAKTEILTLKSYLATIRKSPGTRMFQDFYIRIKGKEKNATEGGKTSCASFLSSVLLKFGLIKEGHLTITGALEDMKESGWREIKELKPGAILLWEKKGEHKHLGFYLGGEKAVSNSEKRKEPVIHHYNYQGKRKIEKIFWNDKLKD